MAKTTKDAKKAAKSFAKKAEGGKVRLVILMDESGSMNGLREAVVTGCNEFLSQFKDKDGVKAWIAFFDAHPGEDRTRYKLKDKEISKVKDLKISDYNPRGMTPLNDAIVDTITSVEKAAGKGEAVFMAIITDGYENASETSTEDVRKLIEKMENKNGWGFVYLGANQVAEQVGANYGFNSNNAYNFVATAGGVRGSVKETGAVADCYVAEAMASPGAAGATLRSTAHKKTTKALYNQTGGKIEEDDDE